LDAALTDPGGISDSDTSLVISGVSSPELWPTAGLILIEAEADNTAEYIAYTSFASSGGGSYTLGGLVRARLNTTASEHGEDAVVRLRTDFCLLPGGACAFLATSIGTTNPITLNYNRQVPGPGSTPDGFAVGRLINIDGEVLETTVLTPAGDQSPNGSK
jgi:hypothetical protein